MSPVRAPRLLLVPGLNDSDGGHWQSWLQGLYRHSVRVVQRDWAKPDLERWSARIAATLERAGPGAWLAVGHSFGCLALAHHLAHRPESPLRAVLLVAPAEPDRFGLAESLPQGRLPISSTVVASDTDPWMSSGSARRWVMAMEHRLAHERRPTRAGIVEWSFAV
ncbi:MAG: alpha/beta hydrolase [Burkholderiales bacterium]|nr:alpha/beta hydrolase [Burkholderiales bacterium]